MSQEESFRVVIVGASVAGLSLANMLQANNINFVVLEAYPDVAPQVGASIGLLPHGNRILDQLGLYKKILDMAPPVNSFTFRDQSDSQLASYKDMDRSLVERNGYPMIFLDRQMLLQVLYDNIKDKSRILTEKRVVKVDLDGDSAITTTSDGTVFRGDMVIAADGVHSTVRGAMWKLGHQLQPGWFEASEKEGKCISDPCPGKVPGGLHCVFRDKSSYLITGGPGGRVYWFRFQRLPRRLHGSEMPRYTQHELDNVLSETCDEPILPGLTFSTLIKNRVTAVMTPLPEYVYKRGHFSRIFTLGDSAHKFHPIGGHGGNAAIETAAALKNSLVNSLKSSSSRRLSTAQIDSIFAGVHDLRRSRAKSIQDYSHKRQLTEALDNPLRKFIALCLLPLADERDVTLSYSAQIPSSEKLDMMLLTHREKLVPYKDELLAVPRSRGK
ncbi:hypothetical protein FZEAL_2072 [Fusarium zealandicum]|uniref:FAD-binding domain-containing protein n=1 Tax=Fusarium zealandicum TaxID=1053134 RepID=A0A8H4XNY3_9HYPO|nr:hypothetical protein FZEAL_2072 [Fusarium zealandicum]